VYLIRTVAGKIQKGIYKMYLLICVKAYTVYLIVLNNLNYFITKSIYMIKDRVRNFWLQRNCLKAFTGGLFLILFLLTGFSARAQNWLTTGNTTTSDSSVLGTTSNTSLNFITNGTYRGTWDSTGRLVVGNKAPLSSVTTAPFAISTTGYSFMELSSNSSSAGYTGFYFNNGYSASQIYKNPSSVGGNFLGSIPNNNLFILNYGGSDTYVEGSSNIYMGDVNISHYGMDVTNTGIGIDQQSNFPLTIDPSAALLINSTSKGLLIPRLTTSQVNAISSPANGLLAYDSTVNSFKYYDGSAWNSLSTGGGGLDTTAWHKGGDNVYAPISSLGTSNERSLYLKTNGINRIRIDSATGTVYMGNDLYTLPVASSTTLSLNSGTSADNFIVATNSTSYYSGLNLVTDGSGGYGFSGSNIIQYASGYSGNIGGTSVTNAGSMQIYNNNGGYPATSTIYVRNSNFIGLGSSNSGDRGLQVTPHGVLIGDQSTFPATQDLSTILQLNDTSKGLLIPRLTTSQVNAISSPAKGLLAYDSTINAFKYYNGSAWNSLSTASAGWSLTGNPATYGIDFLGTTNAVGLNFITNGTNAMYVDSLQRIKIGHFALDPLAPYSSSNLLITDSLNGGEPNLTLATNVSNDRAQLNFATDGHSGYGFFTSDIRKFASAYGGTLGTSGVSRNGLFAVENNDDLSPRGIYIHSHFVYSGSGTGTDYGLQVTPTGVVIDKQSNFPATADTAYALAVNGTAIFTKAKLKLYSQWPDYVFGDDYNLPGLDEVENYIKLNKHLEGIPSADDVKKEGIDVGDNQTVLVKKVEELTLYTINQNKKSKEQDKKIADQDQQIQELRDEVNDLKQLIEKNK
jgi:hypothetical protein